jgi:serine/threonine protein kinase/tetratricopeptide (TPR) repeat protein
MVGKQLLHYEIIERLGSGGMGEVYRARDTKLGREIALKVLPPAMAGNADRRTRFQREAMAVAALKHPNIVTIYAVEEDQGTLFIAMELIEGRSLDHLIPPQGLNLAQLLEMTIPVSDAVAYAHEKGITHRDLKPSNIMLDEAGRPKVLDFGLAKLLEAPADANGATLAADGSVTKEGVVIGTASYMSPEQAEGKPTDARSDVFSLGIILYEMATGRKPFQGDTTISTISSILKDTPPPATELNRSLPHHLGRVVNRCLAKDPSKRYQVALDLKNELEGLQEESASGVGAVPPETSGVGVAPPPSSDVAAVPPSSSGVGVTPPSDSSAPSPASSKIVASRSNRMPLFVGAVVVIALAALVGLWQPWSSDQPAVADAPATETATATSVSSSRAESGRLMAVVFPFENLGPPEDAYFAAGITEEVTNRLATVSGLGVISRTTAVNYDRSGKTAKQIGQDLGVDYVLEGTVRWAKTADGGGRVRISPKLVNVTDDVQVWSETYDREIDDIFEVQSDIASSVIDELGVTLLGSERERMEERPTENLEAYQAYLQALDVTAPTSEEHDRRTTELLERATRLDPAFLNAWYFLARHHAFQYTLLDRTEARLSRAKEALRAAEAVDPNHHMTRLARGYYHYYGFREYDRALQEFLAVAEDVPNDAAARLAIGYIHRRQGKLEECAEDLNAGLELDPQNTEAVENLAATYVALRRFHEADLLHDRAIEFEPRSDNARWTKADAIIRWKGDIAAAKEIMSAEPMDDPFWHFLGWFFIHLYERDFSAAVEKAEAIPEDIPLIATARLALMAMAKAQIEGAEETRESLESAARACEEIIEVSPGNSQVRGMLADLHVLLGNSDAAIREAKLAVELTAKDKYSGPSALEQMASVYAAAGRADEAFDLLDRLLGMSYGDPITVHILRLGVRWDPLRDYPRYQELLDKYAEKIP